MVKTKVADNSKPTAKRKPTPASWKKGIPSPNPKGAPKRGESWAELIKRVGDMTPVEAATRSLELGKQLLEYGDGLTLKEAVVLRVYGAMLFEPQGGLFNSLMDRADGKVAQPIDLGWKEKAKQNGIDPDKLQTRLVAEFTAAMVSGSRSGIVADSDGSGEE